MLIILGAIGLSACGLALGKPLLYDVRVEPTTITPNADGTDDVTVIRYAIGRSALVSIYLEDQQGQRHYWRKEKRRAPGTYEGWFSGVVNDRVLPDGTYRVVVEARPVGGEERVREVRELVIQDADTQIPDIINLQVVPEVFTPNRDGINDRVRISYWLAKEVERIEVYVEAPDGTRYPVPEDKISEATAAGSHAHDYDGGVDLGAEPPPDGEYRVVVEAQDRVGNRVVKSVPLTIKGGGIPRVEITKHDVVFNTDVVRVGETLYFTTTVRNIGRVPVRTHGPEPGTIYTTRQNYNNFNEPISDGAFRLGLDYQGSMNRNGVSYPYRWQLGRDDELYTDPETGAKYLMPGQTVTVWGGLTILDPPPREQPGFWIGLIHENVEIVEDRIGYTYIFVDRGASNGE
ncbi:MAG: hypothetical protein Q9O62_06440 [Ardenticatenia bacterium]|nr:hypothetical protein [Ardenticatenia bacterium]